MAEAGEVVMVDTAEVRFDCLSIVCIELRKNLESFSLLFIGWGGGWGGYRGGKK